MVSTNGSHSFKSATDVAYDRIRDSILAGDLLPGTKLSLRKMSQHSGVSVISVLPALARLERDGLVESMPQWGARVTVVNEEKARHQLALREAIETQAVRQLAGKLTSVQRLELTGMAQALDAQLYRVGDGKEQARMLELHHHFHLRIAEFTGNPEFVDALRRVSLFRLLQGVVERNRQRRDLPADWHMRLVDAIANGPEQHADEVMRIHVRSSLASMGTAVTPKPRAKAKGR